MTRMPHVCITGGAGFIGSHLTGLLLDAGCAVTILDDLSTGSVDNIARFEHHPSYRALIDTVTDAQVLADACRDCDIIIHLAAAVGVRLVIDKPVTTIETNLHGTETVLRIASRYRKKVLIASTSEVYGASTRDRFSEEDDAIIGPTRLRRWSYAASKLMDEFLAFAYQYEKHLPVIVVRLFNTVGPGQTGRYGMVLPTFVRQALRNDPITVYGTGDQTRSFTHVQDVVRALWALVGHEPAYGQVFNIGCDQETTILGLAQSVVARTQSRSEISFRSYGEAYGEEFEDMQRRVPDTTRIRELLGLTFTTPLETIIDDVIAYERQHMA